MSSSGKYPNFGAFKTLTIDNPRPWMYTLKKEKNNQYLVQLVKFKKYPFSKNSHFSILDLTFDTHLTKKLTKLPFWGLACQTSHPIILHWEHWTNRSLLKIKKERRKTKFVFFTINKKTTKKQKKLLNLKKTSRKQKTKVMSTLNPKRFNRIYWVPLPKNVSCPSGEKKSCLTTS